MSIIRPKASFVVFEGYDGAGKSTLIENIRISSSCDVRVVGRKLEPELVAFSEILERDDLRPSLVSEMLLRIVVELERMLIVERARGTGSLVVCDRGVVSAASWFDYLGVDRRPFSPMLRTLVDQSRHAVTIVCDADFETCWERSSSRPDSSQSRKDRLGKDVNRQYYSQYERNIREYADEGADVVFVDTAIADEAASAARVSQELESRGLLPPDKRRGAPT